MLGIKIKGYEKFWNALVGGGFQTVLTTALIWLLSALVTGVPAPGPEALIAMVAGFSASLVSAISAYLATNTEPTSEAPVVEDTFIIEESV